MKKDMPSGAAPLGFAPSPSPFPSGNRIQKCPFPRRFDYGPPM